VIAYDPYLSEDRARALGVQLLPLEELFRRADFITIHTPLTQETRNLINKNTIALMKPGVRIINCARGGIVNEGDLLEALQSGRVAGAALDVFEKEPLQDYTLCQQDRVVCTPHLGAATAEAQDNVAVAIAEQVVDYLLHGTIRNAVNFPSIPREQAARLGPYLKLAEQMGAFASQVFEYGIKELTIEYRGEAAELQTAPVTIAALKGFLTPILEETVNYVNAPHIAKQRGIEVKETKSADAGDYHNMLCLTLRGDGRENRILGTLFGRKEPRIIQIDNFPVELIPQGTLLFMFNNDRPGVIGSIGTLLGEHNINIARMHFGRESAGGRAISVVSVDTPLSAQLLEEVKRLPNILSVKQVFL
jgi:D-3-phosphoglycerate dehydrogenase